MHEALLGRRLVGVIPGRVFISNTANDGASVSRTMKSTRAKSRQPQALKDFYAAERMASAQCYGISAGNTYRVAPAVYLRL